ncbi:putative RED-like protein [Helianthus annuus]|uniref:RED-like protein n=1 Tax=Helianthus annuus TaxID=4232 RepID=A0A9K3ENY5_HELAN|nr:putative RED-like protein [Helianthus annuus]KAJ0491175.1 putative RED-like protein [Helianthus annuus]KAJ0673365.1 putative RED-like protein [Helianthus annuus]KAJ0676720.1 putative RED-like protein [Helianthus annuus]KAJ0861031.1 putative RED-like protein [Helianthus annuus]
MFHFSSNRSSFTTPLLQLLQVEPMHLEEKVEEPEQAPKYRDRAKERREDQNPDYEPSELGSFHAVAPPGNVPIGFPLSILEVSVSSSILISHMPLTRQLYIITLKQLNIIACL